MTRKYEAKSKREQQSDARNQNSRARIIPYKPTAKDYRAGVDVEQTLFEDEIKEIQNHGSIRGRRL